MAIGDDERREVARWAAASAERVLPLFESLAPGDTRPREAIEVARAFADGTPRSGRLSAIAMAAHRAGREVHDPIGLAAARAASLAAATANIHAEGTVGTLRHVLGPVAYAALARDLAVAGDPVTTAPNAPADEEVRWAVGRANARVRGLVRRIPAGTAARTPLDRIERRLELALRE